MKPLIPIALIALLPFSAMAQGLVVHDGYARAGGAGSGAAFMVIRNDGASSCTLVGVSTDAASKAEIHSNHEENGVMRMVPTGPVTIPAHASHDFARGGDHVMLMGLKQPLRDGEQLLLMLDFGACGQLETVLPVDSAR